MMRIRLLYRSALLFCLPLLCILSSHLAAAEKTAVTLGGKGIFGPMSPTAGTIANAVNGKSNDHGIRITVTSRQESVPVIHSVTAGEFELGVAQNRYLYRAYNGLAEWTGRPQKDLRTICNVHPEQIAVVTSIDSGIRNIGDLRDKRVFIGTPQSDLLSTAKDILTAAGIDPITDLHVTVGPVEEAPKMMQDDAIDAFFYILGTTNRAFIDLFSGSKQIVLVPVTGMGIDKLTTASPFYEKSSIFLLSYPGFQNKNDVETISVTAGLVTSAEVPDRIVYSIARALLENTDEYTHRQPSASVLTQSEMTESMAVPIHPGAETYYKHSGISYSIIEP
ncbi:MAG: TAXI family TRAP transporter solute-binding subunit [Desulforhopalus sp.]